MILTGSFRTGSNLNARILTIISNQDQIQRVNDLAIWLWLYDVYFYYRVIPQDGAARRNQEEERKKYHNKQADNVIICQKKPYIMFKSTQFTIFCADNECFF